MGTNFPTALDSFTNPTASGSMLGPTATGHAGQHDDLNDAVTQLEKVSVGPVFINVKGSGAKGDNITDDTTLIQAAASSLTSGGTLFFPQGTYIVSTSITLLANTHVVGAGRIASVVKEASGSNLANGLFYCPSAGCSFRNLGIDGNKAGQTSNGPGVASNGAGTVVTGCRFLNTWGKGIHFFNAPDFLVDGNEFITCGNTTEADLSLTNVVAGGSSVRGRIVNNRFDTPGSSAVGFQNGAITDITIANNVILNFASYGIALGTTSQRIVVHGNVIQGAGGALNACIDIADGTHITITGNQCKGGRWGIVNKPPCYAVAISGNTITNATNFGISIEGFTGAGNAKVNTVIASNIVMLNAWDGIDVAYASDVIITGNLCKNNGTAATGTYGGIVVSDTLQAVTDIIISSNRCTDDQGSKTQGWGLRNLVTGASSTILVTNNDFNGNLTAGVSAATKLTLRNNAGYNPAGAVTTPGFPLTTVAVTNSTGVDVVAYVTAGANAVTVRVDAVTGLMIIPAAGVGTVVIPAGSTFTPTYAGGVPTWVWYGQ